MQAVKNLFDDPAPEAAPDYTFIESFGLYVTRDGHSFTNKDDLMTYLNGAAIREWVDAYIAHVEANPEKYFSRSARKAKTKRDGSTVPEAPAGIVDPKVQTILKGRIRSIVSDAYAFMLANSSETPSA